MELIKKHFFSVFIILASLLEAISKYYLYYNNTKLDLTRYLKLLFFVLALIFLIRKKKYSFFYIPVLLGVFFILGHSLFNFKFLTFELIVVFSKYIFPLFLLETAYLYFKERDNKSIFKIFEYLIIINAIAILIGLLFNVFLFKTYTGSRFGYNGFLITSATSSYFYIIAIFYMYLKVMQSKKHVIVGLLTLMSSLIVGTKSIFLFLGLLLIYYIFINLKKIKLYQKISFSILTTALLTVLFLKLIPSFLTIKNNNGLASAILSYRDILFYEKTLPFINENWNFINYLVGGQGTLYGRTQLGYVDLFFFFGIIGSILYLLSFYKSLFKNKLNNNTLFIILSLSVIVAFSGNFFYSATITIYLIVLQQVLLKKI